MSDWVIVGYIAMAMFTVFLGVWWGSTEALWESEYAILALVMIAVIWPLFLPVALGEKMKEINALSNNKGERE